MGALEAIQPGKKLTSKQIIDAHPLLAYSRRVSVI